MCRAVDDRQPSILTQDQYRRMIKIYKDDADLQFVELPLRKAELPPKIPGVEQILILKFGSNPKNPNYFVCPKYYCLLDEILIKEKDFESDKERDGTTRKPKNSCPFCHGKAITEKKAEPGKTVYVRKNKPKTEKYHAYIQFLKSTSHPEGFMLPCCFLTLPSRDQLDAKLRIDSPPFAHFQEKKAPVELPIATKLMETVPATSAEMEADIEEDDGKKATVAQLSLKEFVTYNIVKELLYKMYILGTEKHPLNQGKVAILPPSLDRFFNQSSKSLVTRAAITQKLTPSANGFLRIGLEETPGQKENFFSALAPLLNLNYISQVRQFIKNRITPYRFLSANFGNLVNEFYRPQDPAPSNLILRKFTNDQLQINLTETNTESIIRIYNAYNNFKLYIDDITKTKQIRHFQSLLAEPGLFTERGIQIIILEYIGTDKDNEVEGPIPKVFCPIYGVSPDRHRRNDIAFVAKDSNNYYEVLIHTKNTPAKENGTSPTHIQTFLFPSNRAGTWPSVVRERVQEYFSNCESTYRSIYTQQEDLITKTKAIIPVGQIEFLTKQTVEGIIRDSYNHVIGVTFNLVKPRRTVNLSDSGGVLESKEADIEDELEEEVEGEKTNELIIIPTIDDGSFLERYIHFGWEDCNPLASLEDTIIFYESFVESYLSLYPGYKPRYVYHQRDDGFNMIGLSNGIRIPCGIPKTSGVEFTEFLRLHSLQIQEYTAIDGMTPEKKKKVARLLGLPVSDDSKEEFVYNQVDNILKQTEFKNGKYQGLNPVEVFNRFADMKENLLHIKDLVKQAISHSVYRVRPNGKVYEGEFEIAKDEDDLVKFLADEDNQDQLLTLEGKLKSKKIASV